MSMTITGERACPECGESAVEVTTTDLFDAGTRILWCGSCERGWGVEDNPFGDERDI